MREIMLDGTEMKNRESAHAQMKARLMLPEYYGRNLDALYDCLTEIGEPTEIILNDASRLVENMGAYGSLIIRVLRDANAANPNLRVNVCM